MKTKTLDCGHAPTETKGPGTGCAQYADGRTLCYGCAGDAEREGMRDRTRPVGVYLASDGRTVTDWPGNVLGTVTTWAPVRLSRWSHVHGRTMRSVRVRDVHGGTWYGRGSPGIALTLRPTKGGARA